MLNIHTYIYIYYIYIYYWFYIPPTCANTSERSVDLVLRPLLGFLAAPQIVRLLSNAKSAA